MSRLGSVGRSSVEDRRLVEALVRRFSERRAAGDLDAVARLIAPDIVYTGAIPNGRLSRQGREAVLDLARAIDVHFEQVSVRIEEILIDGDQAAVRRIVRVRNRGAGNTGEIALCAFLTYRDGLIVEMIEAFDTMAILALGGFP